MANTFEPDALTEPTLLVRAVRLDFFVERPMATPSDAEKAPPTNSGLLKCYALVRDIFFAAKITAAAKRTGVAVEFAKDESAMRVASHKPGLLLIDLNDAAANPIALIQTLKSDPQNKLRIIGYVSHVQSELIREAQKAGADLVLPRSVFSQQLDELLRQHSCYPV
jgi:CheY-like chemotaxis protein